METIGELVVLKITEVEVVIKKSANGSIGVNVLLACHADTITGVLCPSVGNSGMVHTSVICVILIMKVIMPQLQYRSLILTVTAITTITCKGKSRQNKYQHAFRREIIH